MNIHLIAVGGSVMHNLAIALKKAGHTVTGSDDEIYEPARGRLDAYGLLPAADGWDPSRIHEGLDAVILGMHAKEGNPELARAKELGLKTWSFPEFIYEYSRDKQRVVIAGSHGKTTITSMIMHVLNCLNRKFDYLVGGQVQGFDTMVKVSDDAPVIILEGDEYLASALDPRPKFLVYQPHVVLLSGIAWDHINVFPTEELYVNAFEQLISAMPKAGMIVGNEDDKVVNRLISQFAKPEEHYINPYSTPSFKIKDGKYQIKLKGEWETMSVIGKHNMANLAGAWEVCRFLGVDLKDFLKYAATFTGAGKRMENIYEDANNLIIRDFAHSPSKVKATAEAVNDLYGKKNVVACLELHTFSSLNKDFIHQYKGALKALKNKVVYINAHTLEMKNYPPISMEEILKAFDDKNIIYATNTEELEAFIKKNIHSRDNVFLMMSSGNFGGLDVKELVLGK